ncbi:polygalacturonate 4-alpha-galacturonosyltransferase-like [Telopea speciosissima]|uniref:polygalacturonate 4-alpha-galacturonosyltransferase-like n=1 Tax=Telopea speciosissima TaxID=54955 RepID=UPI001CC4A2A0|nr:polygalacturonate 4-alpha-galacturonosyltransferase-like [Telopea speciosissima]
MVFLSGLCFHSINKCFFFDGFQEPEKHVLFHLVTDKLNFGAMNMWFLLNPHGKATIHVENVDDFKWLNSSYCPVLCHLESAAMKEYYFKADHPTTLSAGSSNMKYKNPKYLSMLNHLRFYLPQVYPKLDKILFLDDDIVIQKDYYLLPPEKRKFPRSENLENPNLYHYALFSDNVLAASVVVNSTIMNAKEPEKHVFHLVTDKLNFGAMNMWFLFNPPGKATIHVENVDDFKWLNSSYCPVLHQLESAAMKEYYFKANHPTTLSAGSLNMKCRNEWAHGGSHMFTF